MCRYFKEDKTDNHSEMGSEFSTPHIQPELFDRRPQRQSVDNSGKRRVSASDFDNYRDKSNFK